MTYGKSHVEGGNKKVPAAHQLPCPSIMRGWGLFFAVFIHNDPMIILQKIFADHYEEMLYTLQPVDHRIVSDYMCLQFPEIRYILLHLVK